MTTLGPTSPSTAANVTNTGVVWTNPSNGKVEDGSFAVVSPVAQASDILKLTGFAWAVPGGHSVTNIKVELKAKVATGTFAAYWVYDANGTFFQSGPPGLSSALAWVTVYNAAPDATTAAKIIANTDEWDIVIPGSATVVLSVDSLRITVTTAAAPTTKTQTFDAALAKRFSVTETFDAILALRTLKTHTFDSALTNRVTTSHTWDANMFLPSGTMQQTWDAVLAGTLSTAQTFDVALGLRMLTSQTWDTFMGTRSSPTQTFDAALSTPVAKTHTWDARMAAYTDKTQTFDARLAPQIRTTHTWDALLGGFSHSQIIRTQGATVRTDRPRTYDDGAYDEGTYDSPGLSMKTSGGTVTITRTNGGTVS